MPIPEFNDHLQIGSVPPRLPGSEAPVINVPAPGAADSPPPLPPQTTRPSALGRQLLAIVLSLCLGLFLADAVISLVDDSLVFFFGLRFLAGLRGMVAFFTVLVALLVYGLMGLTPMIPKRLFLPLTLFALLAPLVVIPCLIYCYGQLLLAAWAFSCCQVLVGLIILYQVQGGLKFRWRLVAENQLEGRGFSWANLSVFVLGNVVVLGPAVVAYLALCAALAVDHLTAGFLVLRPSGLTARVRTYARPDGKTVQLVPMAHVAESGFYQQLVQSFPTNSLILLEGVSDERSLLTNQITYKRMATSLGLSEQQKAFQPRRGQTVRADVDIAQFATNTIDLLNLAMLVHAKGLNPGTVLALTQYAPPPHVEAQFLEDVLNKRNRHLLKEIQIRLAQAENLIVPWGAVHMPELAKEIQKSGFRLDETREYTVIRFGSAGKSRQAAGKEVAPGKSK